MSPLLRKHHGNYPLSHPEESSEVDRNHRRIVPLRVIGERLRYEDAGVVYKRVDASKLLQGPPDDSVAVDASATSPSTAKTSASLEAPIVIALATTPQPARR